MENQLTTERLRELLAYDPLTGVFTRLVATSSNARVGDVAGSNHIRGYLEASVDGRAYLCHRLAWLYVTGEWPKHGVDHRDGQKKNNRWKNLRDVTQQVNVENQRIARRDSLTGTLGVTLIPSTGRWRARIGVDGRLRHLGVYPSESEAHQVYVSAKRRLHAGCTL